MPTGNLPAKAKEIFAAAEANARKSTCKDKEDKDACAAKIAWSAVKNKYKKVGDNWVPKADVEFSLFINKASFDKKTQEMRWSAVASDTDEDSYSDNMTVELFDNFLSRIESGEEPPEDYRSEYWNGGMPYLSLAHYPDLNGKAVPGVIDSIFRDGTRLKAKGRFRNNELGKACFDSVCDDLYNEKRSDADNKVRISIAFLDYKHKHKSSNIEFERKSIDEVCPECIKETILRIVEGTQPTGKGFLDGHLIHLALTRVPVNKRTDITVERSMTTQKEDALSIVPDEDLVEEIEQELSKISKSEALVVKSDKEDVALVEEGKHDYDGECPDDDEECKEKMREKSGKKTTKSEVFDMNVDELREVIKSVVSEAVAEKAVKVPEVTEEVPAPEAHILDTVLGELKATYDQAIEQKLDPNATLASLQKPMEVVGRAILDNVQKANPQTEPNVNAEILKALTELTQSVALLKTQVNAPAIQSGAPQRRSFTPDVYQQHQPATPTSPTPNLQAMIRKNAGLQ